MNNNWLMNALDTSEEVMRATSIIDWIGDSNHAFLKDVQSVYKTGISAFGNEYEMKTKKGNSIVNYQVMPLIGSQGVVMVIDDISAEKRAVMTLGRYMSPALAKQVMEENNGELGGMRKKVSILFSDIRSFTTMAERMSPTQVVDLLNQHFTDAVNAISEEEGILDKFIGDAVMAVFGVPSTTENDAIHACNSAIKMRESLYILNKKRSELGLETIKIGIGINTGNVN